MDAGLVKEFIVLEWGLWEWLYIDGTLVWKRLGFIESGLYFEKILAATLTSYSIAALDEVPGVHENDHDGRFYMVDDPPLNFIDIDPRINEALQYVKFDIKEKQNND